MRTTNATLYSGRRLDAKAFAEFRFQTKQGLKSWHNGLDPALRLETSGQTHPVVPAVLQLQYAIVFPQLQAKLFGGSVC
ncbi:fungal specific transcription factor domain-containing protein [Verticillium alfalfae VaMs.102]|uniref:Fungal specific transcription factor domain-containing protein n=1 Tax=Verticillium alfalfae (strain VaMs.102 / ATCC MYA-4576 / FGSC 10136) TaxID=526221 RepID=C9SMS1_VERA1|nr:fungal specific transcription factor domain-containing protein [Verticillium alfalfae VaMs.102]EEY20086.1 fungal specific transcription factor domain-containing protein [Verticillium alfalfae VaMs.102]